VSVAPGAEPQLFIVSGPSGSGKTTVVERLLQDVPDILFSVSCTTRAPRAGEQNGREYHFISKDEFEAMLVRDELLEHATIFGEYYGTPRTNLADARRRGKDLLLDIDVLGARQVKGKLPDAVAILLVPPSAQELERRLTSRAQDRPEVIRRRLERAREELEHYHSYDYLVVNRELEETCRSVSAIVAAERARRAGEQAAAEAAARAEATRKDNNKSQISAILESFGAKTQ
jgi:guanylate kinase